MSVLFTVLLGLVRSAKCSSVAVSDVLVVRVRSGQWHMSFMVLEYIMETGFFFMPKSFLSVPTVSVLFTVLLRFVKSVKCSSVLNNKPVPEPTFLLSVRTHLWEMSFMVLLA